MDKKLSFSGICKFGSALLSFIMAIMMIISVLPDTLALPVYADEIDDSAEVPIVNVGDIEKIDTENVADIEDFADTVTDPEIAPETVSPNTVSSDSISNNGYPWGKDMCDSGRIKMCVGMEAGATSYQWLYSSEKDGTYVEVTDAHADLNAEDTYFEKTLSVSTGAWYKCKINYNDSSVETKPVWLMKYNSRTYISNGQMAYSWIDGTRFDVIGKYNGSWIINTSYDGYWNLYTSSESRPEVQTVSTTSPVSEASLDVLKGYFDEEN